MRVSDHIAQVWMGAPYVIGTMTARWLLAAIGNGAMIHSSVRYWRPSKIRIGDRCEIRQNSYLDARGSEGICIEIGDECRIKDGVALVSYGGSIRLGQRTLVGRGCTFFGHGGITVGDDS